MRRSDLAVLAVLVLFIGGMFTIWLTSRGDERTTKLDQREGCIVVIERSDGSTWRIDRWMRCVP